MRPNDIQFLKWCHISKFHENEIEYTEIYAQGKNHKRHLAADISVWNLFIELKQLYDNPTANDFVFRDKKSSIFYPNTLFVKMLTDLDLRLDTEGRRRAPYSMRHSYASWHLQMGINPFSLAKNMGTSVNMLEKHYGHFDHRKHASMIVYSGAEKFLIPVAPEVIDTRITEAFVDDEEDNAE
ncbi:MAG: hypothetical protein WCJ64_11210 [Rhodospirillaceae bacterium]